MSEKLFTIYLQCVCTTDLAKYCKLFASVKINGRVKQGQASLKGFLKFNELAFFFANYLLQLGSMGGRYQIMQRTSILFNLVLFLDIMA